MAAFKDVALNKNTLNGQYTIVGAKHIRCNSAYRVAVSVHNATGPSTIRLTIENGGDYKESQEVVVQPWSTESVAFAFGVLPKPAIGMHYKLIAEGVQGIGFRHETRLHVIAKEFSFLVQTDKALYKPGDLIRFRVLVIDENTKPVQLTKTLQIHMQDGASNRVKEWSDRSTTNGVFSSELRLSDSPVLGKWTLTIQAMNEKKIHTIEVAEYVLPTFEVSIETASDVVFTDGKIHANIRGKYSFGKPVSGEAVVTVQSQPSIGNAMVDARKVIKVSAKGSVEFDLVDDLKLSKNSMRQLQMDVTLEEDFTGRLQKASQTINVRRRKIIIKRITHNHNYMDGYPFEMDLQVLRYDGLPVMSADLEIWYSSDLGKPEEAFSEKHKVNNYGIVKVKMMFPLNKDGFFVMAKYLDTTEGLGFFPVIPYSKPPVNNFSLDASTAQNQIIGETITIELQSREPLHHYTYMLIARGVVHQTKTVVVENPEQQCFELQFQATHNMLPSVKLVAITVRNNGTTDVSSEFITLKPSLTNSITLQPSVNETQPGQDVELKVTTPPKSFVGLLAIDQNVVQLRSGNDLSATDVTKTLEDYGCIDARPDFGACWASESRYQWNAKMSFFENFGLFVLSNLRDLIPVPYQNFPNQFGNSTLFGGFGGGLNNGTFAGFGAPAAQGQFLGSAVSSVSSVAVPASASAPQIIRKDFPETWIWDSFVVDSADGEHIYQKMVPDTITSWVISAFSLSSEFGLGLTENVSKLTVIKPFFVSLTLPYAVKRGEIVAIPVVVFNYLGSAVDADVTLYNDDKEFEVIETENLVKSISIQANDATGFQFLIKPLKAGSLTIKVTAVSPLAGDGIEQILLVTPEGVPQHVNKTVLVDLSQKSTHETSFAIEVPADAVPDSTRIEATATTLVLGSTIQNLDKLIFMPSGCGEQNMLSFVPNIVIRNYLKTVNQLTEKIELKSRQYMETGYQRQLTYRHPNGSFSAFGKYDASGSTWLTAFVARAFRQAAQHITIEDRIINNALNFLRSVQSENGSFPEVGVVIHRSMQSGAGKGVALTAYTLLAFLENKHSHPEYSSVITKAGDFVVKSLDTLDDVYALAVAAYALQLADHPAKADVLRRLDAKASVEGDRKYWAWHKSYTVYGFASQTSSVNTEITGYALLAHFHAGSHDQVVTIMKWLLSKRNAQGGFASTQDTVVGLQALATISGKLGYGNNDMKLVLTYGDAQSSTIEVNTDNSLVLQQVQLPGNVRDVQVSSSGKGFALLSLAYSYYVNDTEAEPRFQIVPKVANGMPANVLRLTVGASFIPNEEASVSNMAVMVVEFPSGYTFDADTRDTLAATAGVKKVELKNGDTQVVLYFNSLGAESVYPTLKAVRTHRVAHQKPAAITVFDYYDTTRKSRVFYNTAETAIKDICE